MRHPQRVRSLVLQSTWAAQDGYLTALMKALRWQSEAAPDPREFLEAFFLWIYTPRAHDDGTVARIIEEVLAFPYPQDPEDFFAFGEAFVHHSTAGRLAGIAVPALVLAGGRDLIARPELGRTVAEQIPGAMFEVMESEAHQPFQEVPAAWNRRVAAFWRNVERGRPDADRT